MDIETLSREAWEARVFDTFNNVTDLTRRSERLEAVAKAAAMCYKDWSNEAARETLGEALSYTEFYPEPVEIAE